MSDKQGVVVNNFGIGLDATIVHATNHSTSKTKLNKYNLGSFAYLFSILRVFFGKRVSNLSGHWRKTNQF